MLFTKVGNFFIPSVPALLPITGFGFQPKVMIFIANPVTGDVWNENGANVSIGATDGIRQWVMWTSDKNHADPTEGRQMMSKTACVYIATPGHPPNTLQMEASIQSFDADGFTLNFTTVPGLMWRIGYLALGGADVEAYVDAFVGRNTPGSQTISGHPYTPNNLLFFSGVRGPAFPAFENYHRISFGTGSAIKTDSNCTHATDNVPTVRCWRNSYDNRMLIQGNGTGGLIDTTATLTSLNIDGFTLNWTGVPALNPLVGYIALAFGGSYQNRIGSYVLPNTSGVKTVSGIGFQPQFGIFTNVSANNNTGTPYYDEHFTIGFVDASNNVFSYGVGAYDNMGDTRVNQFQRDDAVTANQYGDIGAGGVDQQVNTHAWTTDGWTYNLAGAVTGATQGRQIYTVIKGGGIPEPGTIDQGYTAVI